MVVPSKPGPMIRAALAAAVLLGAVLASPAAYAGTTGQQPEEQRETREYTWLSYEEQPRPDQTITVDGNEYSLVNTGEPVPDPSYVRETRGFSYSLTRDVPAAEGHLLESYFPAAHSVDEDGFTGAIPRVSYSVQEVYGSWTGQVDRYTTIPGLPDNDYSRIPEVMVFSVRSDAYAGATAEAELVLLDVRYELVRDALGRPTGYTAYLTYRGQESWLALDHYRATAYYAGTLTSPVERYTATATYSFTPGPLPALEVVPEAPPLAPAPESEPDDSLSPLLVAAAVAFMGLAVFLAWFWLTRSNIRLARRVATREVVLKKARLKVVSRECVFDVPAGIALSDGAEYLFYLRPGLAGRDGILVVTQAGRQMMAAPLSPVIVLDIEGQAVDDAVLAVMPASGK